MSPIKNIHEVTEPLKAVLRMEFWILSDVTNYVRQTK